MSKEKRVGVASPTVTLGQMSTFILTTWGVFWHSALNPLSSATAIPLIKIVELRASWEMSPAAWKTAFPTRCSVARWKGLCTENQMPGFKLLLHLIHFLTCTVEINYPPSGELLKGSPETSKGFSKCCMNAWVFGWDNYAKHNPNVSYYFSNTFLSSSQSS